MEVFDGRRYFGREVLRVVSQISENGVYPRKHATARPVILNIPIGLTFHAIASKRR